MAARRRRLVMAAVSRIDVALTTGIWPARCSHNSCQRTRTHARTALFCERAALHRRRSVRDNIRVGQRRRRRRRSIGSGLQHTLAQRLAS